MESLSSCLRDSLCSSGLTLGIIGAATLLVAAILIFGSAAFLSWQLNKRRRRLGADAVPHLVEDEAPTGRWERGKGVRHAA